MRIAVSLLAFAAVWGGIAAQEVVIDGVRYKLLEGNNAEISGCVPEEMPSKNRLDFKNHFAFEGESYLVTEIADNAFSTSLPEVTSTNLNDSFQITYIGVNAFTGCINLNEIEIPKSVERIGENAFKGLRLSPNLSILTNSLVTFEKSAFEYTEIKKLSLSEVDFIRPNAFANTSLEFVRCSGRLISIEENGFRNSKNLKNVYFDNILGGIYDNAFDGTSLIGFNVRSYSDSPVIGLNAFPESMHAISFTNCLPSKIVVPEDGIDNRWDRVAIAVRTKDAERFKRICPGMIDDRRVVSYHVDDDVYSSLPNYNDKIEFCATADADKPESYYVPYFTPEMSVFIPDGLDISIIASSFWTNKNWDLKVWVNGENVTREFNMGDYQLPSEGNIDLRVGFSDTTAVDAIEDNDADFEIYSISGELVGNGNDAIRNLPNGVYVKKYSNGKAEKIIR